MATGQNIIEISKTKNPGQRPATNQLGFGKYFSDHMFTLEFENGVWKNPKITPYGPFMMEPGASVFHYGQAMFEGMKAFRAQNGKIHLFRPEFNARRMATGALRLCMPAVPEDLFLQAVSELVKIDSDWIPEEFGSALYLRPTLIGTESFLGVRPSEKYLFFIICSPVSAYYAEGFAPVKIWIEENSVRAAKGGLGAVKAAANYAASLEASTLAKKKGFSQVLWLDAVDRNTIEEVGTMNVFFYIGNEVITPELDGTILAGATRDSVIELLKGWNIPVVERKITIKEVKSAADNGQLKEVFGTGTAAVISAVGALANDNYTININNGEQGALTTRLYHEIAEIQQGRKPDSRQWVQVIET